MHPQLESLLKEMVEKNSSDLHLKPGRPPLMRLDGQLLPVGEQPLTEADLVAWFDSIASPRIKRTFPDTWDADFSHVLPGMARFRVNAFHHLDSLGLVFRKIPIEIPTLEMLGHPPILRDIVAKKQGVVLVTGPTGSGKSTTLAAMIDHVNKTLAAHVITIEDPVEFVYADIKATINQRQVGEDTPSFKEALRRALRQDPDIILVGEMRDRETMEIALHAAETGHLVMSTLHTNSASQSVDRILETFPPESIKQIQSMLSLTLLAILSQRLVRKRDGQGRTAAMEILINSPNIQQLLAEGKVKELDKAMAKSQAYYGMQTFNQALYKLWKADVISEEEALGTSANPDELKLMFKGISTAGTDTQQLATVTQELITEEEKKKAERRAARAGGAPKAEEPARKKEMDRGFDYF